MSDPHDLQRFIDAQRSLYPVARHELAAGAKRSHWMWFVFPQLRGLGQSETAWRFGISSREEAVAYSGHPLLGARLRESTGLVLAISGKTALQIFGSPDDLKFCSSMTLFAEVLPREPSFGDALAKYFDGVSDPLTLELLHAATRSK